MLKLEQDFDGVHTFECGQCFRWNPADGDGGYIGVAGGRVCRVSQGNVFCATEDEPFWRRYFTQDTDYGAIKKKLGAEDQILRGCIQYGHGIRILRQEVWETVISFIISANNNIPRIKKIIESLCQLYGEAVEFEGGTYYTFPSAARLAGLSQSDLAPLKAGYRDRYILDAAQKAASGEVDLSGLDALSTQDAKAELMKIKGVGGKVADCILLFSLGRYEVFPKDVWTKRILSDVYQIEEKEIDSFVACRYGENAGIAQQYLYYYYRDNPKKAG